MDSEIIVLRVVHILGGTFWVGAMLFNGLFLFPALATVGPGAGPIMAALQRRRLMTVLPIAAVLTILSGGRLMWITSAGMAPGYLASPTGRTLAVGAVAGIVAFLIGMFVGRPTAVRSAQVAAQLGTAEGPEKAALASEMATLRRRGALSMNSVMALLILASGAMAIARYLG